MAATANEKKAELKARFGALLGAPETPSPAKPKPAAAKTADKPSARTTTRKKRSGARTTKVEPMPLKQVVEQGRPRRLMVPLSTDEDHVLKEWRVVDGVPAAARVRALLALYRSDDRVKRKADDLARQMR